MSVVGIDFGNENCAVAVARRGGVDIVLNEESNRETPAVVCFGEKQRLIGAAGGGASLMNPRNSITQVKRLIGRPFADPDLQRDLGSFPFTVVEGPDGFPLIEVDYMGHTRRFSPTQVYAMVLSNLKGLAEKNLGAPVVDCCIGIPIFFTDIQRRSVLNAAKIAGLNALKLVHETTATALEYGIYKTDLPAHEWLNVAFVDVGHSSMQVCIAGYRQGELKIWGHAFDQSLGGRDFNEALFRHFAAKFKDELKIDVLQNARASVRLRTACEKLKKVLSVNPVAHLNIECLLDEKDVNCLLKREEFEEICRPILDRVVRPLEVALNRIQLDKETIHAVEVAGSGSRIPAIIEILTDFFKKEPRRTTNSSECVAHGCALQCASLSPAFHVREFQVHESFPYSVTLSWKVSSELSCDTKEVQRYIFTKGSSVPCINCVEINLPSNSLHADIIYVSESGCTSIGQILVGPFSSDKNEQVTIKLVVSLNNHGILNVESATLLEVEERDVQLFVKEEQQLRDDFETDNIKYEHASVAEDIKSQGISQIDVPAYFENGGTDILGESAPNKFVHVTTGSTLTEAKRMVKETKVPFLVHINGEISEENLQRAVAEEYSMADQDKVTEETKDKKNAVEAYVYDMREKLSDKYGEFATDTERESLSAKLQKVEDWLYDEGEDLTKEVYVSKLEELKKRGDLIEARYKEHLSRGSHIKSFNDQINRYRWWLNHPDFRHLGLAETRHVAYACDEAEKWLTGKTNIQYSLRKCDDPILTYAVMCKRIQALDGACFQIFSNPKPTAQSQRPQPPRQRRTPPPRGTPPTQSPPPPETRRATKSETPSPARTPPPLQGTVEQQTPTNSKGHMEGAADANQQDGARPMDTDEPSPDP